MPKFNPTKDSRFSNLSEKSLLVLKYLYNKRETGDNYNLGTILNELGIRSNDVEVRHIGEILRKQDFAIVAPHLDGVSLRIKSPGVQFIEDDEFETSETAEGQSIEDLIHHIDLKFANLAVDLNLNTSELAKMIDELKEQFTIQSKPAITRLVGMKVAEYFISETIKTGVVRPVLKELREFIISQ